MEHSRLRRQLEQVVHDEDLFDPSWVLELDDIDEPPLFSRRDQVDFLREVPEDQRGMLVLAVGLNVVDLILAKVREAGVGSSQRYFVALTLSDWDVFARGEQSVPTVAVEVNPHDERNCSVPLLAKTDSNLAARVQGWLKGLGVDGRFRVMVNTELEQDDLFRVYVVPAELTLA